jgi:hemoglobin
MKKLCMQVLVLLFFAIATKQGMAQESLYKRLGGYDAIAAVTDDFIGRLAGAPSLQKFFGGVSADSQKKLRQHVVDQICQATGGPCVYTGRSMKQSHEGLKIREADWNTAVALFGETLKKFNVPAKESGELVAIVASVKKDIVEN